MDHPNQTEEAISAVLQSEHFRLRIPSQVAWIDRAVRFLETRAKEVGVCTEQESMKIALALHEALTNSVVHGNLEIPSSLKEEGDDKFSDALKARTADLAYSLRNVEIETDYNGTHCFWTITDEGNGFDVEAVMKKLDADPTDEEEFLLASGRGILMMKTILDFVNFEQGGRRAVLGFERSTSAERRGHSRFGVQQMVRIIPLTDSGTVDWSNVQSFLARDFSASGLSILRGHLPIAERVIVEIERPEGLVFVPAEVCRTKQLEDGLFEFGCRFLGGISNSPPQSVAQAPPPEDEKVEIELLVNSLKARAFSHDARRTAPRMEYKERVSLRPGNQDEFRHALARDLSKNGIAVVSSFSVAKGDVEIILPCRDGRKVRTRGTIVRCEQIVDGLFDIGVKFQQ